MENASRAILIAGAILIVLIVIAIAIAFISKTEVFTEMFSDNLSEKEIANHNAIFAIYDGKISGTQVNTLVSTAEANNAKSNIKIKIRLSLPHTAGRQFVISNGNLLSGEATKVADAGTIISNIDKNRMYTSNIRYNGKGFIEMIEISDSI